MLECLWLALKCGGHSVQIWLFLALLPVIAVLVWFIGDHREREYLAELATRELVSEEELFCRYFVDGESAPDVPGRVRRVFAQNTGYPEYKILPDDDLTFFWFELDMIPLIRDLEREFGIEITDADAEGL